MKKIISIICIFLSLFTFTSKSCFKAATIDDVKSDIEEENLRPFEEFLVLKTSCKAGNQIYECQATLDVFKQKPKKIIVTMNNIINFFTNFLSPRITIKESVELAEVFIAKKRLKICEKNIESEENTDNIESEESIESEENTDNIESEENWKYLFYGGLDSGKYVARDKSIYKAHYLLLQYFLEKNSYWKRNKLDPKDFPTIRERILKLIFLSTETLEIKPKASSKYRDIKIIFN